MNVMTWFKAKDADGRAPDAVSADGVRRLGWFRQLRSCYRNSQNSNFGKIALASLFVFFSVEKSFAWLYQIEFKQECPKIISNQIKLCLFIDSEKYISAKKSDILGKNDYEIFIKNTSILKFTASEIMIGGYPYNDGYYFSFGKGRYALKITCDPSCKVNLIKSEKQED